MRKIYIIVSGLVLFVIFGFIYRDEKRAIKKVIDRSIAKSEKKLKHLEEVEASIVDDLTPIDDGIKSQEELLSQIKEEKNKINRKMTDYENVDLECLSGDIGNWLAGTDD